MVLARLHTGMNLLGKGYYIWQIPSCESGNAQAIAQRALNSGYSHVLIKIADGAGWDYNVDKQTGIDLVPPLIQALHDRNIQAWGWHYVRGDQPVAEAETAIHRIQALGGVDGYVIDAETEYRDRSKAWAAQRFMQELRQAFPSLPMGLSTFRYPKSHPDFPYSAFLEGCDYAMPQVYFELAHNPVEQLQRSIDEYSDLTPARPIIPTLPTYKRGDWQPTPDDIFRFLDYAKTTGLTASNAWSWDIAGRAAYTSLWNAVAGFDWPGEPPLADMPERLVGRINEHDAGLIAGLYTDTAAHVTGERTVVGRQAIQDWYDTLLMDVLPRAEFQVTGKTSSGSTRHFTWTARSTKGDVVDGNDTLNVQDGRIRYHYTYFHVS